MINYSQPAAPPGPLSSAELAQVLVMAAVEQARKRTLRLCIAIVDAGGHLLAFQRMDGSPFHLVDIARDKAITAASFGISTHELAVILARQPNGTSEFFAARPNLVLLGGGVPVMRDGELLGGLGISGSGEDEDEACAVAALQACLTSS